jgi:hypothetical protein
MGFCRATLPKSLQNQAGFELFSHESVFTPKNAQCMKILLNIASCMGGSLEGGWLVVLETFQHLDRILHNPIMKSQDNNKSPSEISVHVQSNDFSILAASLNILFENSKHLNQVALRDLLQCLRKISQDSLNSTMTGSSSTLSGSGGSTNSISNSNNITTLTNSNHSPAPSRMMSTQFNQSSRAMFGVTRMLETTKYNIGRISVFWDIIFEHFSELCNHSVAQIRNFGVDALTQTITLAMTTPNQHSNESGNQTVNHKKNDFLNTLDMLARSPLLETREKSLGTLYHLLRAEGQNLGTGWAVVLSMIMTVAVNVDKPLISLGFKCAQLVCSDFMSNLSPDCVALFITTVGCYGLQNADLNISLTAINILWIIADFLSRGESNITIETNSKESAAEIFQPLWISVFTELKQLGADIRAEVRNCAVQTLFKTLCLHGDTLTVDSWQICLDKIVCPLTETVRVATFGANTSEIVDESKVKL